MSGIRASWMGRAALWGTVCVGMAGCLHQTRVVTVPQPAAPQQIPVDTTAKAENPAWVQKVPLQPAPVTAVTVPTKKVKKPRKAAGVTAAQGGLPQAPGQAQGAPVQMASAGTVPEASVIGALTPGGNEAPQLRKQATELIATLEKRLAGLPAELKERQKEQVLRVLNFRRQAQTALATGDSEGAVTLATKAGVLLDDLMKQGS